jgi:hypothetical protein
MPGGFFLNFYLKHIKTSVILLRLSRGLLDARIQHMHETYVLMRVLNFKTFNRCFAHFLTRKFHEVSVCCAHMNYTYELHIWTAHMGCTYGLHVWTAHMDCTYGLHIWTARIDCTYGLHVWTAHMDCTYGLHIWTARNILQHVEGVRGNF